MQNDAVLVAKLTFPIPGSTRAVASLLAHGLYPPSLLLVSLLALVTAAVFIRFAVLVLFGAFRAFALAAFNFLSGLQQSSSTVQGSCFLLRETVGLTTGAIGTDVAIAVGAS
jgi:hypothetical protein